MMQKQTIPDWPIRRLAVLMFAMTLVAACGNDAKGGETSGTGSSGAEKVKVTAVTNWFAQAEHGGLYAALEKGFYEEAGLDMTIEPGGPQVSSTQIVASGKAQFGMGQADQILLARESGIPLVVIFASFETSPQGLMVHKEENIASPAELEGRNVYVASGASYWEYLKKAYNLQDVQEMAYTGSLAPFLADGKVAIQGYVTSEPYEMREQNVDVDFLLNADFGYNPYANVLFTTESYLKENPEIVKAFVNATAKGFDYFKEHYEEINPVIQKENPDMPLEKLNYAAEAMIPLVYGEEAQKSGVGRMTQERWDTLAQQMTEAGMLKEKPDVTQVFTNEFFE
ncbi:ABC transporter permease [Paenibacillus cisolokensis]|uniref:ABC transporter permease n=1 Tax=Paenibacillus cisolokensis TaxID=1658519 RepID=A0ABQ4N0R6_9BACL|nr:ABC transporter substrate-binding protein [Paenibacillus cisolokensis]GIQ61776.1 ABC transporter permease [Paenibacillus cisolokensis]